MKVWKEYAGDHSAKLKIVGTFEEVEDRQRAIGLISGLIDILKEPQTKSPHGPFSEEVLAYISENNYPISEEAVKSADYCHDWKIDENENAIIVRTDDVLVQLLVETFIQCKGKIEIFSLHDYKQ